MSWLSAKALHLRNPKSGQTKWYHSWSPMVFFFATLLFPFATRRLWGWLTVFVLYDLIAIIAAIAEEGAPASTQRGIDNAFRFAVLILGVWAAIVANKKATRRLLTEGWVVSAKTPEDVWQRFKKRWNLPDAAREIELSKQPA